jgi:hypothetical protein
MIKKSFIRLMHGATTSMLREAFKGGMSVPKLTAAGRVIEALNAVVSDEIHPERQTMTPEVSKKVIAGLAKIESAIRKHHKLQMSPSVKSLLKILRELVLGDEKPAHVSEKRKARPRSGWSVAETDYLMGVSDKGNLMWDRVAEKLNKKFNVSRSASSVRHRYWRVVEIETGKMKNSWK